MLYFSYSMGVMVFNFYVVVKIVFVCLDIDVYFFECIFEFSEFDSVIKNLLLLKGLFICFLYLNLF